MKKYIGLMVLSVCVAFSGVFNAGEPDAASWLSDQQLVSGALYLETDVANADQSTQEAALSLASSHD